MNFSEKYGNDIEEAVALALRDLKASREDVEVEVLEEPSKGFLGLGSKLAKVRVTLKEEETVEEAVEIKADITEAAEAPAEKAVANEAPAKKHKNNKSKSHNSHNGGNNNYTEKRSIIAERPADLVEVEEHKALDFLKQTTAFK